MLTVVHHVVLQANLAISLARSFANVLTQIVDNSSLSRISSRYRRLPHTSGRPARLTPSAADASAAAVGLVIR